MSTDRATEDDTTDQPPAADIVAEQLAELIERVEEVLEDEGLLPPDGD